MANIKYRVEIGQRFGRGIVIDPEVVIWRGVKRRNRERAATLKCDCGNTYTVRIANLFPKNATGIPNSTSCGCAARDHARAMGYANRQHGKHNHPLYNIWTGIIKRCENQNDPKYPRYGGRGIKLYVQWYDIDRFITDIESSIGPRPGPEYSLDRKDNDGNYEPGNVKWSTPKQQSANQERNFALGFMQWAKEHYPEILDEYKES